MRCRELEPHYAAYIDGELDAALHVAVDKHIKECRDCREMVRDMRLASAVLTKWRAAEPSESFISDVRRRISRDQREVGRRTADIDELKRQREARLRGIRTRRRLALAASVLCVVGATVALMWGSFGGDPRGFLVVADVGRTVMNVRTVEELDKAQLVLDTVIANEWAAEKQDVERTIQLEVVSTMMQTATSPEEGKYVGEVLHMLAAQSPGQRAMHTVDSALMTGVNCVSAMFSLTRATAQPLPTVESNWRSEAMKLEKEGKLAEAHAKYDEVSQRRLLASGSLVRKAALEMKLGRLDDAIVSLDVAEQRLEPDSFDERIVRQLKVQAGKAVELMGEVVRLRVKLLKGGDELKTLNRIGRLQVRAGDYKGAEETFARIARTYGKTKHPKDHLSARLLRAWCLLAMNRHVEAGREFERLMKEDCSAAPEVALLAQFERARILQYRKRYGQAIDDYRALCETSGIGPGCVSAIRFQIGYIYCARLGDMKRGAEAFGMLLHPDYADDPFAKLAAALLKTDDE